MKAYRKQAAAIRKAITAWREAGLIDDRLSLTLSDDLEVIPFDWKKLAKYSFWIAIICILIALGAAFADEYLRTLWERILNASDSAKCAALCCLSGALYFAGMSLRRKHPEKIFSSEAILFFGVVSTAAGVGELGLALGADVTWFSWLILLSCLVYAVLGYFFQSNLIWLFSLLALGGWLGAQTGYASGYGAYYLGMNYPLRFSLFGAALTMAALGLEKFAPFAALHRTTLVMGLLYLFVSLWILSIFGNQGDLSAWEAIKQSELLGWSILFALAAFAAAYHGLRHDNRTTRGFGITFVFINLYTRYFENFWNMTHKAIFFALLGLSFWLLGSKAEKIWNLGQKPRSQG